MKQLKHLLLCLSLASTCSLSAEAQIKIESNGLAVFGNNSTVSTFSVLDDNGKTDSNRIVNGTPLAVDTLATAIFFNRTTPNKASHISFGRGSRVSIGEAPNPSGSTSNILLLKGANGICCDVAQGRIFNYNSAFSSSPAVFAPFQFYTDIKANGFLLTSDIRLKSNIKNIDNSSHLLNKVSPISYTLTNQKSETAQKDNVEIASINEQMNEPVPTPPDTRTRYGFMAQEIKNIFPDLVVEGDDGILSIDYIGFIPILVDAIKSMSSEITELRDELSYLKGILSNERKMTPSSINEIKDEESTDIALLRQNSPNPFNSVTTIHCVVPDIIKEADIHIYDLQGHLALDIPITGRGETSISISASELTPGIYIYSLITDGMEIDSKRMILTR